MNGKAPLPSSRIFWFWMPLATMWLMMAIEHPAIAAVITRLSNPEPNLAIFGVTYSLALIIESPVIMLLTAGTALARDGDSYERLLHFTHILSAVLTAIHLFVGLTPLYRFMVGTLLGVPGEILEASRPTFLLLTPWTAGIAYRRLWQGVLIRFRRTKVVPLTMVARLVTAGAVLALGLLTRLFRGSDLGAMALSAGVIVAAITAYCFVRSTVRQHLNTPASEGEPLTWRGLLEFYVPLALTSLINLAGRPLLVMGIARAARPLVSLAVWPVIMGALFLGRCFALSFQEVVVALMGDSPSFEGLRRFAFGLALALTGSFAIIVLTPAAGILYRSILGLPPELVPLTIMPTLILSLVPGLETLISWNHGLFVHFKQTRTITCAVMLNVAVLGSVMFGSLALLPPMAGVTIAAVTLTAAVTTQLGYLSWRSRRLRDQIEPIETEGELLGRESASLDTIYENR